MGAHFVGRRDNHKTAAAAFKYQILDHKRLGFGNTVPVYRGDGTLIGWAGRERFIALSRGTGFGGETLRRGHPRAHEGDVLCLSVPARVAGAMKLAGLLDDPRRAFNLLAPAVHAAMRPVNAQAHGRTIGGQPVKGDILYAVFAGYTNRAGELSLQANVWVFPTVRAQTGRHYALHPPSIFRAQQRAQGTFHLGVAHALRREAGVVCGPKGNSFVAFGVRADTRRAAQMRRHLRDAPDRGHRARQRAARTTRAPKKKEGVTWAEAVGALKAAATGTVTRAVKAVSEARETALARKAVRLGFGYCAENARRFSAGDAFAAGAHVALPHVRPAVFAREFDRLAERPERLGAAVVKRYPDGNVLYTGGHERRAEERAARALWALTQRTAGGLTQRQVARALAGQGHSLARMGAVQKLAGAAQAVLSPGAIKDPETLRLTAKAYAARGRDVYAVGQEAGKALGRPALTAHGLAESLTRTSHLRSLWRGLRTPGPLAHKLWVAEQVRKNGHTRLKPGSLVVVSADTTGDSKAVVRIAEAARKANAKLVVTGQAAKAFERLAVAQARPDAAAQKGQTQRGARL